MCFYNFGTNGAPYPFLALTQHHKQKRPLCNRLVITPQAKNDYAIAPWSLSNSICERLSAP